MKNVNFNFLEVYITVCLGRRTTQYQSCTVTIYVGSSGRKSQHNKITAIAEMNIHPTVNY